MTPAPSFLDALKAAADEAGAAEDKFRREVAQRIKALESERSFAFRRLNLMRAIADVVAAAESEEIAVANASAMLRARLGWSSDSDARNAVIEHFAPVAQDMFASLSSEPPQPGEEAPDVLETLADFERWYADTHPAQFWTLFEHYMPETPVVDF